MVQQVMDQHGFALPMNVPIAAALAIVLVVLFVRPRPHPGIPHFPITSILGDIPKLLPLMWRYGTIFEYRGPDDFFSTAVRTLGPCFQVLIGPFFSITFVADAQEIEDIILRSRSKLVDASDANVAMFSALMPEGQAALLTNDQWRRHRRVTTALMSSKSLSRFAPFMAESCGRLVRLWEKKLDLLGGAGVKSFSCQDDFHWNSLDIVSQILLGQPLNLMPEALHQIDHLRPKVDRHGGATFALRRNALADHFLYIMSFNGFNIVPPSITRFQRMLFPLWIPFSISHFKFKRHMDSCIEASRARIRQARELGEEPLLETIIDMVVGKEGVSDDERWSDSELRDEIMTFLLGGHDTISNAMGFAVRFLSEAPQVQEALHAELLSVLKDNPEARSLSYAELTSDRFPYLDAVTMEVLRCSRVAEGIRRSVKGPLTVLGHHLPAGNDVIFCSGPADFLQSEENADRLLALDPLRSDSSIKAGNGGRSLWKDAAKFDPSRWLTIDESTGRTAFNPRAGYNTSFGLGPRICAGRNLAVLELRMLLSTLNLAFFFDRVPKGLVSDKVHSHVSRGPVQTYVTLRRW